MNQLENLEIKNGYFNEFCGIHLVTFQGIKQIANLTDERQFTLKFFSLSCRKYYILSG